MKVKKITDLEPALWAVVDDAGFELFTGTKRECLRFIAMNSLLQKIAEGGSDK